MLGPYTPVVAADSPGAEALPFDQAVAYQINPFHDGAAKGSRLVPPLRLRWSANFGGSVSYPLIAGGKVFVTVASSSSYGTTLYALDVATGQTLWSQPISGTYYWSNAAYDAGKVFVVNFDGLLRAFDAATGDPAWELQLPGQYAFSSPPTATEGIVYVGGAGSGGTVYAVDDATQAVLWTQSVANGDHSSPVVTSRSVFVSYACPQTYALNRATGGVKWHYSGSCSGGGGKTVVYHRGRVYARDVFFASENGNVFHGNDGTLLGTFQSTTAPAFAEGLGYFVSFGTLTCKDLATGNVAWSFSGDGGLASAPIVVNGSVYVGSTGGNLYALEATTGALQWSTSVGTAISGPDEQNVSQPLTGLGAGSKLLVVPAGSVLLAYGN
jgi:outer membrane protein assembly factor BamB